MVPRILIIAGSDSGGGAGIQADIKTVTMLGGHAMTAITAITAQNTLGVDAVMPVSDEMVANQMAAVIEDIGVDAVKIGMLGSVAVVRMVAAILVAAPEIGARSAVGWEKGDRPPGVHRIPIVVDPVMVAKGGALLADNETVKSMVARLMPLATLITPNAPELEVLTGLPVRNHADAKAAAMALAETTGAAVLAKGAHLAGTDVVDQLVTSDGKTREWTAARIDTNHTHGTGCTLASAIACGLGAGLGLEQSITRARDYVRAALLAAPGFGAGHGPMGHALGRVPFEDIHRK